jgi:hypothetical protein
MMKTLNFKATVFGTLVALTVSYVICIAGDLLLGWTMYEVWTPLLPGFTWPLTAGGFLIGLVWLILYSIYIPLVFVLPYNYFFRRSEVQKEGG